MKIKKSITLVVALLMMPYIASAFDHDHSVFDSLLKKHVKVLRNGLESKVDYLAFKQENSALKQYLTSLSAVSQKEFDSWTKEQRLSFLINAYNGFTIELILKNYPVKSIKKIGSMLQSPWKIEFISLLGETVSLDDIEHGLVRKKGVYDEPRIHFALVCASIGCPALHNNAFTGDRLETMLEKGLVSFLSDNTRNRYHHGEKRFEVSKIFKWYGGDFKERYGSVNQLLNRYGKYLVSSEKELRFAKKADDIEFLDYDWNLNDTAGN